MTGIYPGNKSSCFSSDYVNTRAHIARVCVCDCVCPKSQLCKWSAGSLRRIRFMEANISFGLVDSP